MTVLKQLGLLLEKHLSELYHATDAFKVLKILKDNAVKMTFQADADVMSKKSFYLSTMRVKYGSYADYYKGKGEGEHHIYDKNYTLIPGNPSKRGVSMDAVVNINGDAVKDVAQVKSVDYWGPAFTKGTGKKEEQEERIFTNKSELAPLAKYVNAIYIFIDPRRMKEYKSYRQILIDTHKFKSPVPIYFYDKPDYFMSQVKSKALTDAQIDAILGTDAGMTDDEKQAHYAPEHDYGDSKILEALMQIYRGEKSDNKEFKHVYDLLAYYRYDAQASLGATIHNAKYRHLPIFADIAKAMRKEKIANVSDFITLLMKKIDERYEKEQAAKEKA